ncbi:MAG: 30S ribosomal protein S27ae [Desulfurococcales archaeon]|jgi:small subunit ribosomal protein S27Ae
MSKEKGKGFRSSLYIIDPSRGTIKPRNKLCPRCGSMMGYYKPGGERWYCGKCHYTEFIRR